MDENGRKTLLVFGGTEEMRGATIFSLTKLDYRVLEARDPLEVGALAERCKPKVILLLGQRQDGVQEPLALLSGFTRAGIRRRSAILVLTTSSDPLQKAQLHEAGADEVLQYPCSLEVLVNRVEVFYRTRQGVQ